MRRDDMESKPVSDLDLLEQNAERQIREGKRPRIKLTKPDGSVEYRDLYVRLPPSPEELLDKLTLPEEQAVWIFVRCLVDARDLGTSDPIGCAIKILDRDHAYPGREEQDESEERAIEGIADDFLYQLYQKHQTS
jgi:hypothetical protein